MTGILYVICLSFGSIIALFLLTKLIGYRQMSEMSMFDYITGITIGSIAAEMATSLESNYLYPLIAMVVYTLATILLSTITSKSIKARRILAGKPLLLLDHDELYLKNLKKAKIDIAEFLVQCRVGGYFDISKIETAILEENGKVSFLPKAKSRPVTPDDLNLNPSQDFMVANVIIDGKILPKNLRHTGKDKIWLHHQLKGQGVTTIEEVFLATCDRNNKLTVFLKDVEQKNNDILA